jgi:AraC-like DNA-binding protein
MNDLEAFGSVANRVGFRLRRWDEQWEETLSDQLAPFGLTPARASALVYIGLHDGCDQAELGQALRVSGGVAMRIVNDLVAIGAVERRLVFDGDGVTTLILTPSGHELRGIFEEITVEHDQLMLGALSAEENAEVSGAPPVQDADGAVNPEWRQRILSHIDKHLDDPELRTSSIADAFNVSSRYIQLIFADMGLTVSAYILDQRLSRAAERLRTGKVGRLISDVAFDVGFQDLSYFSRCFRSQFGMSAKQYRALHGEAASAEFDVRKLCFG